MLAKAIFALATVSATFCPCAAKKSIFEVADGDDRLGTLVAAVTAAGLEETLSEEESFTVFAPTDEAFQNINATMLLEEPWRAHLKSVVLHHVLGSEIYSEDFVEGVPAETLEGTTIAIRSLDPLQVEYAEIIDEDVKAGNGVVHVVDDVLLPPSMIQSIVDRAVAIPTLSTLVELLAPAGLAETLAGGGPFTVFAPTDAAFAAMPDGLLDRLAADALNNILRYHVVPGIVLAEDLKDGAQLATLLDGSSMDVTIMGTTSVMRGSTKNAAMSSTMVNGATIVFADVLASNGVVHLIDRLMLPPPPPAPPTTTTTTTTTTTGATAPASNGAAPSEITTTTTTPSSNEAAQTETNTDAIPDEFAFTMAVATISNLASAFDDFETLVSALGVAEMVDTLHGDGPYTLLGPVNEAFGAVPLQKLLQKQWWAHLVALLSYHIIPDNLMASDFQLKTSVETLEGSAVDVTSQNPPMINGANIVFPDVEAANGMIHAIDKVLLPPLFSKTIVDLSVEMEDTIGTLLDLILEAGLADVLSAEAPFTLFAPSNQAFNNLPTGTVEKLREDPTGALKTVLLNHLVEGNVLSYDLSSGAYVSTLLNPAAAQVTSVYPVMINDSKVIKSDVLAMNGVVHIVDTVMLPGPVLSVPALSAANQDLGTVVSALGMAQLGDDLSGEGPFTFFTPVNEAFESAPVSKLLQDEWRAHLKAILLYHVVPGSFRSNDLQLGTSFETLEGSTVTVTSRSPPKIDDAKVLLSDVEAVNGVIHEIDKVLLPPFFRRTLVDLARELKLLTFVDLLVASGLERVLSAETPFTIFAPSDSAFEDLPRGTIEKLLEDPQGALKDALVNHVVHGNGLSSDLVPGTDLTMLNNGAATVTSISPLIINDSKAIQTDVLAMNGVIHVMDAVLLPEPVLSIPALAAANDDFSTLVAALGLAELVDTLRAEGPFTFFAPVNNAFRAVRVAKFLEDEWRAHLKAILMYHVVPGSLMSADLQLGATLETLEPEGSTVALASQNPPMINDAAIILSDTEAANGVIHAIDKVLLPSFFSKTIGDLASELEFNTLADLVLETGLEDVLEGRETAFTVFAPSNTAFDELPSGTLSALRDDDEGGLRETLMNHVVEGNLVSADLEIGTEVGTMNGATAKVTSLDPLMINGALVVVADALASNGVIYVIDSVFVQPIKAYPKLKSVDHRGDACMEVRNGIATGRQRAVLGDCSGAGWRMDDDGMFHSELNHDFCLQAGYGSHNNLRTRVLRIEDCDADNQLQRWAFENGGEIHPALDPELCVIWQGLNANVGRDQMYLMPCNSWQAAGKRNWILQ